MDSKLCIDNDAQMNSKLLEVLAELGRMKQKLEKPPLVLENRMR